MNKDFSITWNSFLRFKFLKANTFKNISVFIDNLQPCEHFAIFFIILCRNSFNGDDYEARVKINDTFKYLIPFPTVVLCSIEVSKNIKIFVIDCFLNLKILIIYSPNRKSFLFKLIVDKMWQNNTVNW